MFTLQIAGTKHLLASGLLALLILSASGCGMMSGRAKPEVLDAASPSPVLNTEIPTKVSAVPLLVTSTPAAQLAPGQPTPGTDPVQFALLPGQSEQLGKITFTLVDVSRQADQTVIAYRVDGVTIENASFDGLPPNTIELDGGRVLQMMGGGGGGGGDQSGASTISFQLELFFQPLPEGITEFTLIIPNRWQGSPQVLRIPVKMP